MDELTFEGEIKALIDEAEAEREKMYQRVANAQRNIQTIDARIAAYKTTLDGHRRRYGLDRAEVVSSSGLEVARAMSGFSTKDMLAYWADQHGGELVVNELVTAASAAGLFQDKEQAASTFYAALGRIDDFEKLGRGRYRRIAPRTGEDNKSGGPSLGASPEYDVPDDASLFDLFDEVECEGPSPELVEEYQRTYSPEEEQEWQDGADLAVVGGPS